MHQSVRLLNGSKILQRNNWRNEIRRRNNRSKHRQQKKINRQRKRLDFHVNCVERFYPQKVLSANTSETSIVEYFTDVQNASPIYRHEKVVSSICTICWRTLLRNMVEIIWRKRKKNNSKLISKWLKPINVCFIQYLFLAIQFFAFNIIMSYQYNIKFIDNNSWLSFCTYITVFQCTTCKKQFRQKYNLNQHKKTHSKEVREYPCKYCSFKSAYKKNLRKHMRNVHPNVIAPKKPTK